MIDIHCHILPNISGDDGSPDMDTTLEMLQQAKDNDIHAIICTPHGEKPFSSNKERILEMLEYTQTKANEFGITLYSGTEYNLPQFIEIKDQDVMGLANTKFVMIDFVRTRLQTSLDIITRNIYNRGVFPICAHPERIFHKISEVNTIFDYEFSLQLTASSIIGEFGKLCQKYSLELIDCGLCHYIASDAHSQRRTFNMKKCREFMLNKYGRETTSIIFDKNPELLLQGKPPLEYEAPNPNLDDGFLSHHPLIKFFMKQFFPHRFDNED